MSEQAVEANVILTADTSGYDAAMLSSAQQTDAVGKSVDSLTAKLDRLTKSAGKKSLGFGVADLAGITAATAAYGSFEKQMTSLEAQAAALNKTFTGQERTFDRYTSQVNKLRKEFPITTSEAAQLVQTLSKLSDNTEKVDKLAGTFTKLGAATGESSTALANSLLGLQRAMGNPQKATEKYSDVLTTLAASTNTSATAITDFSNQIAPVGRMIGMTTSEVMGVSTAFIKAGQDGYTAGNAFQKMMSDIAYASQTGSPELAKYSNLVGMTMEQFDKLGGAEKAIRVFESLNKAGPSAIQELNRMGLDGMRTMRAITAMSQQSGGLRSVIETARGAEGSGSTGRAAEAANTGLIDSFAKLRNELTMTAEAMGKRFAGPARVLVDIFGGLAGAVRSVMDSGFGTVISLLAGAVAPAALLAGAIGLLAGKLVTFATGAALLKGSLAGGFVDARRGYRAGGMDSRGVPIISSTPGAAPMSAAGQRVASGEARAAGRMMYNWGLRTGDLRRDPAASGLYQQPSQFQRSLHRVTGGRMGAPAAAPGVWSRGAYYPMAAANWGANLVAQMMAPASPSGIRDWTTRPTMFNQQLWRDYIPGIQRGTANAGGFLAGQLNAIRGVTSTSPTAMPWVSSSIPGSRIGGAATPFGTGTATPQSRINLPSWLTGAGTRMENAQRGQALFTPMGQATNAAVQQTQKMIQQAADPSFKQRFMSNFQALQASSTLANATTPQAVAAATAAKTAMPRVSIQGLPGVAGLQQPTNAAGPLTRLANQTGLLAAQGLNTLRPGTVSMQTQANMATNAINPKQVNTALNSVASSAAAVDKANKGLALGTRNLAGTMTNVAKSFGAAAAGGTGMIGGLGLRAAGAGLMGAMGGPVGLALTAGMVGYGVYEAKRDRTEYTKQDLTGIADAYLGGQSLPALTQSGIDVPVENVGQAREITKDEAFGARSSDYKLTNEFLEGLTRDQAVQSFAGVWDQIKVKPQELHNMAMDLTNQFGTEVTEGIFEELDKGVKFDPQAFMESAYKATNVSREEVGKSFDGMIAAMTLRERAVGANFSQQEGWEERAANQNAMLRAALAQPETNWDWGTGYKKRRFYDAREDFLVEGMLGESARGQLFSGSGRGFKENMFSLESAQDFDNRTRFETDEQRVTSFLTDYFKNEKIDVADKRSFLETYEQVFGLSTNKMLQMDPSKLAAKISGFGTVNEITAMMGEDPNSVMNRLATLPGIGKDVTEAFSLPEVKEWLDKPESSNAAVMATDALIAKFKELGYSTTEVLDAFRRVTGVVMDPSHPIFQLAQAGSASELKQALYEVPLMSKGEQMQFQGELFKQARKNYMESGADGDKQKYKESEEAFMNYAVAEADRMQQLILQQEAFNRSKRRQEQDFGIQKERMDYQYELNRERAEEDFNQSREYAEFDFQLSRQRAENNFYRSKRRQEADFQRSQRRATYDFNLSRQRQEEDYLHQVERMTEQSARSIYNIYQRTDVQRTASADWLLYNSKDQLADIRGQSRNLDTLREMGVSDDVIQGMDLTNSQNAQQLERLVSDFYEDPKLVENFNKSMKRRLKAAGKLVTDESNSEWQEFQHQHRKAIERATTDFDRGMRLQRQDYRRMLRHQNQDFKRGMREQQDDYERIQDRQAENFDKTMDRAAEDYGTVVNQMESDYKKSTRRALRDFNNMSKELSMNLEQTFKKAIKSLSGHTQEQARIMLGVLQSLDLNFQRKGIQLTTSAADIFGVEWDSGKRRQERAGNPASVSGTLDRHGIKEVGGGSAGHTSPIPVTPIAKGQYRKTAEFGQSGDNWASTHTGDDYAAPIGTPIHAALPGVVVFAGTAGDYGNMMKVSHGEGLETWYAHQSNFSAKVGDQVAQNEVIGKVGMTGNTTGPHVHFEVRVDGNAVDPDTLGQYESRASYGSVHSLLQDRYPKLERIASKFTLGSPDGFFPEGFISDKFNDMATRAIDKMARKAGVDPSDLNVGSPGHAPKDISKNASIGRQLAAARGWTGRQWDALYQLWHGESGWDHTANNPYSSAYGIPQALMALHKLPSGYVDYTVGSGGSMQGYGGDPATQIKWGLGYIAGAYGTPGEAYEKWQSRSPHWYGTGAIFDNGAQVIGVGERGAEMVMPLDRNGVEFLTALMNRMSPGLEARNGNTSGYAQPLCAHTVNTYQIDRSTSFSGPITVQANNPNELIDQLRQRQRTHALSQPMLSRRS